LSLFARRGVVRLGEFVRSYVVRPLALLSPVIGVFGAAVYLVGSSPDTRRMTEALHLVAWGTAYCASVAVVAWFTVLSGDDRSSIKNMLRTRNP
jgi:hypothetical protein